MLWVQGCPFRCPGCVAPETLPLDGGDLASVSELAQELVQIPEIEGITFSGGEPMLQAAALCSLIDRVRATSDLSWMSYTGFTLEQLRQRGSPAQRALLQRLDILVDGLYVRSRATDLKWRGSDNQRVHLLSDRYRHLAPTLNQRGHRIEFEIDSDGSLRWMGIPPSGFRDRFEAAMRQHGFQLHRKQVRENAD